MFVLFGISCITRLEYWACSYVYVGFGGLQGLVGLSTGGEYFYTLILAKRVQLLLQIIMPIGYGFNGTGWIGWYL